MAIFAGKNWTRQELTERVGHMDQLASIRFVEAADGRARGSRVLAVDTGGGLCFHVLAERALDITTCRYQGLPLAWAAPSGEVHPAYYEADGLGWLRSFAGGLVTTCGLDHFGAPARDNDEDFGIHGRISNLPAEHVSYRTYWQDDDYHLEISGEVRQARLFGEHLVLRRRINTTLGSRDLTITDTVTNEGFNPQPHMILYHCNLGFPLIGDRAEIHVDSVATIPRDADAEAGLSTWRSLQPPQPNFREQVFRHTPHPDDTGHVAVSIHNPDLHFGLRLRYDASTLPHLFQWKMTGQGAYVLGIEPANSAAIEGRAAARERSDLPILEPGESRSYALTFSIIDAAN